MQNLCLQGRTLTPEHLDWIRGLIAAHADWGRFRLSVHIAEQWNWRNGTRPLKDMAARTLLRKLAQRGLVKLPARQSRGGGGSRRAVAPAMAQLAGWLILITNAPADKLPDYALSYLYRVRWHIELVFKQCKSVLRLDTTEADDNVFRVQWEIWGRLTAAAVVFSWHRQLQATLSHKQPGREISFARLASQLRQNGMTLALAFMRGPQRLTEQLWRLWRQLLHTTVKGRQRARKTTLGLLNEHGLVLAPGT
jgi:hypothetical protein